jgi:hypothetical protein
MTEWNEQLTPKLFIDQPSQVYFPSDIDAHNTDKEEVNSRGLVWIKLEL